MGNIAGSYINVHEAARTGHIDEVKKWVDKGRSVDVRDHSQKTPLHYAAQWGQAHVMEYLIQNGADVEAKDNIGDTPLNFACYWGKINCVRLLLNSDADPNSVDQYGNFPSDIFDDHVAETVIDGIRSLVWESQRGWGERKGGGGAQEDGAQGEKPERKEALDDEEEWEAAADDGDGNDDTQEPTTPGMALERTTGRRDIRTSNPSNSLTTKYSSGGRLLCTTGSLDDLIGTSRLLQRYTRHTDEGDMIDMHWAAQDGQVTVINAALGNGREVDELDSKGWTPLMHASKRGKSSSVKCLLKHGADVGRTSSALDQTALHIACYFVQPAVVLELLKAGADPQAQDAQGRRPGRSWVWSSYMCASGYVGRKEIRRRLGGDLSHDAGNVEGPMVFPLNSPLETYDVDHRPKLIRLPTTDDKDEREYSQREPQDGNRPLNGIKYYLRRASVQQWLPTPNEITKLVDKAVRGATPFGMRRTSAVIPDEIEEEDHETTRVSPTNTGSSSSGSSSSSSPPE